MIDQILNAVPPETLYFHINNGGVSVTVEQGTSGVLVKMSQGHFGIASSSVSVCTTPAGLQALGDFFHALARKPYRYSEYGVAELPYDPNRPRSSTAMSASKGETSQPALKSVPGDVSGC